MANLIADENVPLPMVEILRQLGHDILTALEAGRANLAIPDVDVLSYAISLGRAVVTNNGWDFHRLHPKSPDHAGIMPSPMTRIT